MLSRRLPDQLDCFIDIERLWQVFECTALVRGHGVLKIGVRGYDNNRQVRADAAQAFEQGQAIHARHAHVRYQHIRRFFFDGVQKMFAALETSRLHVRLAQGFFEHPAH